MVDRSALRRLVLPRVADQLLDNRRHGSGESYAKAHDLATPGELLEKLTWGGKVVGLRVALAAAVPSVVKQLISHAWKNKAPKGTSVNHPPRANVRRNSFSRRR